MADGRVVFDGAPHDLTESVARELYGLEAGEVIDLERTEELDGSGNADRAQERHRPAATTIAIARAPRLAAAGA
jgi:hypothetical protein